MTHSTHSPGPWTKAEASNTIPIKDANGKTVAAIRWRENDDTDANLISAAPDLLAAVEECHAFIRGLRMAQLIGNHCIDADFRLDKARAAINKAKGIQS